MQRGIEHEVCLLLIRENPGFLAPAHAVPHFQRFLRRRGAELVVAHDAAQKPRVGGADAVVVIQVQAGQFTDVNFADEVWVEALVQRGIQAVNALHDKNRVLL